MPPDFWRLCSPLFPTEFSTKQVTQRLTETSRIQTTCRQLLAWGCVTPVLKCGKSWEEQVQALAETGQLQPEQAPGNRQSRLL